MFPYGFLTRTDKKGSLVAEWRAKTLNNKFGMTTSFLIISLRWRITLLKQRGRCELSEIAETLSVYSLRKGFQVVYLFDCMKTREPWTICQE